MKIPGTPAVKGWSLTRFDPVIKGLVLLFCSAFMAADLYIILSRILYPYQLEWMEGAALVQVDHILRGQGLYAPPSIQFVAMIYPPLFFYVSAVIARLFGLGFGALRLVSFLSTVGCESVLYFAVSEKTRSKFTGILAAGSFAAVFLLTGQWFDIARVDMLAAGLTMAGIYLIRERQASIPPIQAAAAGLIFSLAFLSKQSALGVALAVLAYEWIFHWRQALWLTLSFVLSTAVLFLLFWIGSSGWIYYYLFTIPKAHAFDLEFGRIISVLLSQFSPIPIWLLIAILPVLLTPRRLIQDRPYRFYLVMALALLATGVIGRLNAFSGPNVYIPSYLGISLLLGLEAGWLQETAAANRPQTSRSIMIMLQWIFLLVQFGWLGAGYLQIKTIPNSADRAAGDGLVSRIKTYPGDVLVPDANYLLLYAGKNTYYNEMAMSEIRGEGNLYPMPEWRALEPQIAALIHSPDTSAILLDFQEPLKDMISDCRQQPISYPDKTTFIPVAGPPNARLNLLVTCH